VSTEKAGEEPSESNWCELRQRAVSRATTDDTVLVDIKEDEDDRIPATVKEAYLNRQKMLMTHFKVASDKNEVR
jgi:hypothetical protein